MTDEIPSLGLSDELEFHPLANLFPLLEGKELQDLADDIRENGQQEPITLYRGEILDGRNRYWACRLIEVEPKFEDKSDEPNPLAYVISLNVKRRHMNTEQRAMSAAKLEGFTWGGARGQDANLHVAMTRERAGQEFNVSVRSVADARAVLDQAHPDFRARVERGGVRIDRAAFIVKNTNHEAQRRLAQVDDDKISLFADRHEKHIEYERKIAEIRAQPLVIPDGRFNVFVIDPAWALEKVAADLAARDEEPGLPYPTMSVDEIRAWGLEHFFPDKRTTADCHLFLWVVDRFLEKSFGLVRDWGFEPSRVHTWHKNTVHGLTGLPGYNSEFVLYARRGSPTFDNIAGSGFVTCFDGVNKGHSQKPDEFYEMVRRVTPGARRIDVFSRSAHEGFEACGNEVDKFPAAPVARKGEFTLEDLGL